MRLRSGDSDIPWQSCCPKWGFNWSETCQHAFDFIKTLLTRVPVLAAPDFTCQFGLSIDASPVYSSRMETMKWSTKKITRHQICYFTIKRKALALFFFVFVFFYLAQHVSTTAFFLPFGLFLGHPHSLFVVYVSSFSSSHMKFTLGNTRKISSGQYLE